MERLLSTNDDGDLIEIIQEEIEEEWEDGFVMETDKAWDAIHRCLTDGKLGYENGSFPLNACIMGGEQLHEGDDYIISLVRPEKVSEVANALMSITESEMKTKYLAFDPDDYDGEMGDEDFKYTWDWFKDLPSLFKNAAKESRAVLFTVDQ